MNLEFKRQRVLVAIDEKITYWILEYKTEIEKFCGGLQQYIAKRKPTVIERILNFLHIIKIEDSKDLPGMLMAFLLKYDLSCLNKFIENEWGFYDTFVFFGYKYKLQNMEHSLGRVEYWQKLRKQVAECDSSMISLSEEEISNMNLVR